MGLNSLVFTGLYIPGKISFLDKFFPVTKMIDFPVTKGVPA